MSHALRAIALSALTVSGFLVVFGAVNVSLWYGLVMITENNLQFGKLTAFQAYQIEVRHSASPPRCAVLPPPGLSSAHTYALSLSSHSPPTHTLLPHLLLPAPGLMLHSSAIPEPQWWSVRPHICTQFPAA